MGLVYSSLHLLTCFGQCLCMWWIFSSCDLVGYNGCKVVFRTSTCLCSTIYQWFIKNLPIMKT
jgi:hypothetical protein